MPMAPSQLGQSRVSDQHYMDPLSLLGLTHELSSVFYIL